MSASIIRPVAAAALRLLAAVVLWSGVLWSGASVMAASEAPGRPSLEKNGFYLTSSGFRVQVANDAAGQKALRALPARRFVTKGVGDAVRYFYADPQRCVCIFVGTRQAYDNYRTMLREPARPADSVAPDYKTQAGMLLSNQPLRQSTRRDPTTLSDYLGALRPQY